MKEKETDFTDLVGPALSSALVKRGFTALMPVQQAMLDPKLEGRDLRVSSQTGSGKTVAIGLAIRDLAEGPAPAGSGGAAQPRALIVVPTRELAKQVDEELTWLYAPLRARVASVIGGSDPREERRALGAGPAVVVGTPGRLLDHLNRGAIDPSLLGAVVLDEADRMLDLGFREELEAILAHAPEGHRTHLVSATFPRDVLQLANRVQKDPARIEGTPLGSANADIDHLIHLVAQRRDERVSAIVNLLLATPGAQTLVFARTRADVADITRDLTEAGFDVRALSGEMEQGERNRALAAFKRGNVDALVATDVAARGIDVPDIARVIHAEPPTDVDSYTHRSGRTGRAGRKGVSSVLVSPGGLARVSSLLRRAGAKYRIEPIPSVTEIRNATDERVFAELTADDANAEHGDPRIDTLAERLAKSDDVAQILARLLAKSRYGSGPQPRVLERFSPPPSERPSRARLDDRGPRITERGPRPSDRGPRDDDRGPRAPRVAPAADKNLSPQGGWVSFRFTWGSEHGADARRLVAMACRRGGIRSGDIGAIQVTRNHSVVQIAAGVAADFAKKAGAPDPRDPRVTIRRENDRAAPPPPPAESKRTLRIPAPRPSRPVPAARPSRPASVPAARPSRPASIPAARPSRPKPGGHAPPKRKTYSR